MHFGVANKKRDISEQVGEHGLGAVERAVGDGGLETLEAIQVARFVHGLHDAIAAQNQHVAMSKLFFVQKGEYVQAEQEGGIAIAGVTDIQFPAANKLAADQTKESKDMLSKDQADEILALYVSDLTDNSKVKINEAILQQMYGQAAGGQ